MFFRSVVSVYIQRTQSRPGTMMRDNLPHRMHGQSGNTGHSKRACAHAIHAVCSLNVCHSRYSRQKRLSFALSVLPARLSAPDCAFLRLSAAGSRGLHLPVCVRKNTVLFAENALLLPQTLAKSNDKDHWHWSIALVNGTMALVNCRRTTKPGGKRQLPDSLTTLRGKGQRQRSEGKDQAQRPGAKTRGCTRSAGARERLVSACTGSRAQRPAAGSFPGAGHGALFCADSGPRSGADSGLRTCVQQGRFVCRAGRALQGLLQGGFRHCRLATSAASRHPPAGCWAQSTQAPGSPSRSRGLVPVLKKGLCPVRGPYQFTLGSLIFQRMAHSLRMRQSRPPAHRPIVPGTATTTIQPARVAVAYISPFLRITKGTWRV